ncbi:MAG: hypothetical protein ACREX4_22210 [Gammaproteobacteria bacterium]
MFGPLLGPRRYVSERFGVSGERWPKGRIGSGAEPDGSGDQEGSGQLESIEGPGRCSGRCSGGQTEMGEHLSNDGGIDDGGDDPQGAPAVGALLNMDLE